MMAHRSDREPGHPAECQRLSKPAKQSGTRFADTIRASGHKKGRINRPDTRLHPTKRQNIKSSLATREPSTQDFPLAHVSVNAFLTGSPTRGRGKGHFV